MEFNTTKNLFNYATKELSQDAFLRWLIENWNSEEHDVCNASREVLDWLLNIEVDFDNVLSLETKTQVKSIDILVDIKTTNGNIVLVIEDKTYSGTHDNQLERYKEYVDIEYAKAIKKYIYYKSSLVTKNEGEHVKSCGWEVYSIGDINKVFSRFKNVAKNNILKDYCDYIIDLNNQLNGKLPDNIKDWSFNNWMNFCINHNLHIPKGIDFGFGNYRNQYIYVVFNLKGKWNKNPYAEIRSRDFYDNKFVLKILLYDVKSEYLDMHLDKWRSAFGKSELFKLQSYKKQIAINSTHEEVSTVDDLKKLLSKYIDEYLKIML